jgi:RNA polymerase sigma-70 factor (ECF subfamily)
MDRDRILEQIRARILRWATSKMGVERAQDLAQEVMIVLIEKYSHLDDVEDLLPVAFQTAKFKWVAQIRKIRRRGEDQYLPIEESILASREPGPDDQILERERRQALLTAVGRLTGQCQELLTLQLAGTSLIEIIRQLGVPSGTIYARSNRCRKALRGELQKILGETEKES